jgi:cation-transporting ATPase 13A3/4/5
MALIIRTGFLTTKGSLVRDILYPKPLFFQFYADGIKFVAIMALTAIVGFLCVVPQMIKIGTEMDNIIDRGLDMFTICIPPAIPAALSCGAVFAVNRLKKAKIFCIAPQRVNIAGSV